MYLEKLFFFQDGKTEKVKSCPKKLNVQIFMSVVVNINILALLKVRVISFLNTNQYKKKLRDLTLFFEKRHNELISWRRGNSYCCV